MRISKVNTPGVVFEYLASYSKNQKDVLYKIIVKSDPWEVMPAPVFVDVTSSKLFNNFLYNSNKETLSLLESENRNDSFDLLSKCLIKTDYLEGLKNDQDSWENFNINKVFITDLIETEELFNNMLRGISENEYQACLYNENKKVITSLDEDFMFCLPYFKLPNVSSYGILGEDAITPWLDPSLSLKTCDEQRLIMYEKLLSLASDKILFLDKNEEENLIHKQIRIINGLEPEPKINRVSGVIREYFNLNVKYSDILEANEYANYFSNNKKSLLENSDLMSFYLFKKFNLDEKFGFDFYRYTLNIHKSILFSLDSKVNNKLEIHAKEVITTIENFMLFVNLNENSPQKKDRKHKVKI